MAGTLEGITVAALEQAVAAPLATSRLADAGARVIKLERHEGDFARGYDTYARGLSSYFVWINRGKESCRVDLKNRDDLRLVHSILAKADVFIQNLAPGATERLGIGSVTLRRQHPRLITCDISGYAPGTPDYQRKAYDLLIQAETGLCHVSGTDALGANRVGISICDIATGNAAYAAILEAIMRRSRTSNGSHIQISLFDTLAEFMNVPYLARRYGGSEPARLGLAHPSIAPYGVFQTLDGAVLLSIQNDREWVLLCEEVLRNTALADDPKFATNTARVTHRDQTDRHVQAVAETMTSHDFCALLDQARIAYGRVSTMADLMQHESLALAPVATPGGPVDLIAPAAMVDGNRPALGRIPALGEHDDAIRREFLGEASVDSRGHP